MIEVSIYEFMFSFFGYYIILPWTIVIFPNLLYFENCNKLIYELCDLLQIYPWLKYHVSILKWHVDMTYMYKLFADVEIREKNQ